MEELNSSDKVWQEVIGTWGATDFEREFESLGINIPSFSDALSGREAPSGYGRPVAIDVVLAGKKCDIYHTDYDGEEPKHSSGARIFVHVKD